MTITAAAPLCERCHHELRPEVAYCDHCGLRTARARRLVRLAVRYELIGIGLTIALIFGFAYVYLR